jgi:hypothetical protein
MAWMRSSGRGRVVLASASLLAVVLASVFLLARGGGSKSILATAVGQCVNTVDGKDMLAEVKKMSCRDQHDLEVFYIATYQDGAYPGDQTLTDFASQCDGQFEGYVGQPVKTSGFHPIYVIPDRQAWGDGIHKVLCALAPADDTNSTGSEHNAGG